jgi:hypothetical protein
MLGPVAAVLWQGEDGSRELCVLERADEGWRLRGTVLTVARQRPVEIRYRVVADAAWRTEDAEVLVALAGGDPREPATLGGLWSGKERPPEYADCADVDLGFTPATNTLPIRRLRLEIGQEAEVAAVWVRWPELTVERAVQRYARLAKDRYRFFQEEFEAELVVDDQGLVLDYEGLWRAVVHI